MMTEPGKRHPGEALERAFAMSPSHFAWVADGTGMVIEVNAGWKRITGHEPQAALRWGWADFLYPEDRGLPDAWKAACAKGKPFTFDGRIVTARGEVRALSFFGAPLPADGDGSPGWAGIATDISRHRHKAGQDRRDLLSTDAAAAGLAEMMRLAGDPVFRFSPLGVIDLANDAAARELGAGSPLEGRTIGDVLPCLRDIGLAGCISEGLSFRAECAVGEEIFEFHIAGMPWLDAGHAYGRNITARKKLEDQLRHALKLEAVGQLAGGVAHDFNNLLMIVLGYSSILAERFAADEGARKMAEEIRRAGERAADLTRQLLAFSQRQALQPKAIDANAVLMGTERMLRRILPEHIELSLVPGEKLGPIFADPAQLEQVIVNLAVNAADAMPDGGKLLIETLNAELDAEYAATHPEVTPGAHVALCVSDTGSGIPREVLPHVFEPFFTTKEVGKGTGLGLATVHGIVRQSGGHIFVYSEPEAGTVFKLYFPLHSAIPAAPVGDSQAPAARRGGERILLAEDDAGVRAIVRQALDAAGFSVTEACDGMQALQYAENPQHHFDLLVTDLVMPRMSGHELIRQLRIRRPELRALFISGYTQAGILRGSALDDGITFLPKPFSPGQLLAKIGEVLEAPARG